MHVVRALARRNLGIGHIGGDVEDLFAIEPALLQGQLHYGLSDGRPGRCAARYHGTHGQQQSQRRWPMPHDWYACPLWDR